MMPATHVISLYDDWSARRERLLRPLAQAKLPAAAAHVKVLEYLLSRYRDAEVARAAAMFPLPSGIELNERAIIINHHLGSRYVAGVKTADEARSRVASILQRMAAPTLAEHDDAPWPGMSTLLNRAARRAQYREEDRYLALASDEYQVRSWALNHFALRGGLQDTGLLSDLANIQDADDRFARERREILAAMRRIGLRCHD